MVPGVYVLVSLNQPNGKDGIALLSEQESEYFAKLEAEHANQNPFAADYATT